MGRLGFSVAIGMAGLLLATMGSIAAVGFGCLSLYFYLSSVTTPALAALGVAAAAIIFAIAVAGLASMMARRPWRAGPKDQDNPLAGLVDAIALGKTLGLEGSDFLKTHLSKASMAALGLGLVMGISPKLRKAITDLLLR